MSRVLADPASIFNAIRRLCYFYRTDCGKDQDRLVCYSKMTYKSMDYWYIVKSCITSIYKFTTMCLDWISVHIKPKLQTTFCNSYDFCKEYLRLIILKLIMVKIDKTQLS